VDYHIIDIVCTMKWNEIFKIIRDNPHISMGFALSRAELPTPGTRKEGHSALGKDTQ
jgi:hypothetical protein